MLAVAAALFVALAAAGPAHAPGPVRAPADTFSRALHLVVAPVLTMFGLAAYLLPLALGSLAVGSAGDGAAVNRFGWRLLLSIPLLSTVSVFVGTFAGTAGRNGGLVGLAVVEYMRNFLGAWIGLVGSLFGAVAALAAVWHVRPGHVLVGAVRAARMTLRKFKERVAASDAIGGRRFPMPAPAAIRPGVVVETVLAGPTAEMGTAPETRAPWVQGSAIDSPGLQDEAEFRPLPAPALDEPLPLDILPEPEVINPAREQLELQVPELARAVASLVRRISGLRLVPVTTEPSVGLNTLSLEFAKEDGQSTSVRNVERVLADIGVETGRAPVRLELGARIRFELPLNDHERRFAPIKPALIEARSREAHPITYLIGRRQDGTLFELAADEARHVLVGGSTGGGKTVWLHALIFWLVFQYPPSRVRLALADNKVFEFSRYRRLPHLWQEVVTSPEGFGALVDNLYDELGRRKRAMAESGRLDEPAIVVIVDEFSGYDSQRLVRLVAEARALKMFFVLATQHPTADVISSAIKANLVTGVAFKTKDTTGSRLIVGVSDATSLRGRGDCLVNAPTLTRVQAAFVSSPSDSPVSDLGNLVAYLSREVVTS